jgi:hypothetical protein
MRALHRRVQKLEALVAVVTPVHHGLASERWSRVLRIFLPIMGRMPPTPEVAVVLERLRRGIAHIDDYSARFLPDHPWSHLEYYCGNCLARLTWTEHGWGNRRLAFLDADYDDHMRQIEEIETVRLQQPVLTAS